MNPSIPTWETIAAVMFVLAFLAFTMEYFGTMIFESLPFLDNLLARDGKYIKGASFKRLFLTLIAWKITSGFHFGVLTLFLRPDFEIARSATSLDYFITAGIIGGGSAVVYEYIKRLKAMTVEVQSKAAIVESKAEISAITLENAGGQ